jgi:hypothetical protein
MAIRVPLYGNGAAVAGEFFGIQANGHGVDGLSLHIAHQNAMVLADGSAVVIANYAEWKAYLLILLPSPPYVVQPNFQPRPVLSR